MPQVNTDSEFLFCVPLGGINGGLVVSVPDSDRDDRVIVLCS